MAVITDEGRPFDWCAEFREQEGDRAMDFGEALKQLKAGKRVARRGASESVRHVPEQRYQAVDDSDRLMTIPAQLTAIGGRDGRAIGPWVPSPADLLADDWEVVDGKDA